jgi:hypothetical protein
MSLRQQRLIEELMSIMIYRYQTLGITDYKDSEFIEILERKANFLTDDGLAESLKWYLRSNSSYFSIDALYGFAKVLQSIVPGVSVNEMSIEAYTFILERVQPDRDWQFWLKTQVALAETYHNLERDQLSSDCLVEIIDTIVARDKKRFSNFVVQISTTSFFCCFAIFAGRSSADLLRHYNLPTLANFVALAGGCIFALLIPRVIRILASKPEPAIDNSFAAQYRWLSLERSWLKHGNGRLHSSLKCFRELTHHYY